jgi:general secretion pathway protein D
VSFVLSFASACTISGDKTSARSTQAELPVTIESQKLITQPKLKSIPSREIPRNAQLDRTRGTGSLVDVESLGLDQDNDTTQRTGFGDTFIYRDTPIDAVVNDILGENYGLSFSVDPNVRGNITIRLEGITSAEQAVSAMDNALGLQGYAIISRDGNYLVTRSGSALQREDGRTVFVRNGAPLPKGAGTAVLEIQNALPSELTETVGQMGIRDLIRASDDARGLITLAGEPERLSEAVQLLRAFDVDWLSAISTAIVPLKNAPAEDIASELEPIFARTGGIEFIALPRLEALLVIGRTNRLVDQGLTWIDRLDKEATASISDDTLIYQATHLNASDLLQSVQSLFGAQGSTSQTSTSNQTQSPASQTASAGSQVGDLRVAVDEGRNAILARGDSTDLEEIERLLQRLDTPQPQILIEATIVEVTLTDDFRFGVQWAAVEDQLRTTFSDATNGQVSSRFPGVSISYVNVDLQAVINALNNVTDVEVVSSPRVSTLNNVSARLQVGDQVPVITQSAVSIVDPGAPVVNSVSFRDTGVILNVTPRTRGRGMIEIDVSQEVSGVAETTTSGIDSPTITQRRIESTLVVPEGATAVLGGLISSTRSKTNTGVPILMDIPFIGQAFKATGDNERRTELVILIRPTLVNHTTRPVALSDRLTEALLRVRPELLE